MDRPVKNILVVIEARAEMHRANNGENPLGNVTAVKKRPDGRVYISGQMQRHALFSAIRRLDNDDNIQLLDDEEPSDGDPPVDDSPDNGEASGNDQQQAGGSVDTYTSPGSAVSPYVEEDLRADLGGFLQTNLSGEEGRRTGPVSSTPAVATEPSETLEDLLLRLDLEDETENDPVRMEMSQSDLMRGAFSLDCTSLSTSAHYSLETVDDGDRGVCVEEEIVAHAKPRERLRRAKLFLEATRMLNDYASQSRNMMSLEPTRAFVVLDTRISRKAARFFELDGQAQKNLIEEIEGRGGEAFYGNDGDGSSGDDESDGGDRGKSVDEAYSAAHSVLEEAGIYQEEHGPVQDYRQAYSEE